MTDHDRSQFFSLVPESSFFQKLMGLKEKVYSLVGEQQYLLDSPHLTLYVGDFDYSSTTLQEEIRVSLEFKELELELLGFESFCNDPVTKKSTIVVPIAKEGLKELRNFQKSVVETAKKYRVRDYIERYKNYKMMHPDFQKSVENYGFPFVGKIWKPHFTLGSFDKQAYPKVLEYIKQRDFRSKVKIKSLVFNHIHSKSFQEIWKIHG